MREVRVYTTASGLRPGRFTSIGLSAAPGAVIALQLTAVNDGLLMTFGRPLANGSPIVRYDVVLTGVQNATLVIHTNSYVFTDLPAGNYSVQVTPVNLDRNASERSGPSQTAAINYTPSQLDFDGPTYDYDANTGPRPGTVFTNAQAPISAYKADGNWSAKHVLPALVYDVSNVQTSIDRATCFNVERWNIGISDCIIEATIYGSTGTTAPATIDYSIIRNDTSSLPQQGCVYGYVAAQINHSKVIGYQDVLWISDYTKAILFTQFYDKGDFTFPYISKVYYSYITGARSYGYATYNRDYNGTTFWNMSADYQDYPMKETVGTIGPPMSVDQIMNSIPTSSSVPVNVHVGDFIAPDPNHPNGGPGVYGGRWQVIGSTGSDRSPTAACTLGTDYATWRQSGAPFQAYDKAHTKAFVSGTAILIDIGASGHNDAAQMARCNGFTHWYRSRLDSVPNAGVFICQPTIAPAGITSQYDPAGAPTSYLRVEECDIIANRVAYLQGATQDDPITGVHQYPAYGYRGLPRWATFKNNWIEKPDGSVPVGRSLIYSGSAYADTPVFVSSEARRYDGVLAQLDSFGVSAMTTANGGTMPTGTNIVANEATLGAKLRELEYTNHILMPSDGYNGTPNNLTLPVFANRSSAGISKSFLDARCWVAWEGNRSRTARVPVHPVYPSVNLRPWLAADGSDNGYYSGTA